VIGADCASALARLIGPPAGEPKIIAYTRSLKERTVMIALSFSPRVGRRACAGKMLINHLVGWHVRVLISCSNPYQSVVVELMKGGTNTRETTN
jgi:hypothetical protein